MHTIIVVLWALNFHPLSFTVTLPLSLFGGGNGTTYLNDVGCSGLEERLEYCNHSGVESHTCDDQEEVGVTCAIGT